MGGQLGDDRGTDSGAGPRRLMVGTDMTSQRGAGEFKVDVRVRWHEMQANK